MIRTDLYAVKVRVDGGWCYEFISDDKQQATNMLRFLAADHHRSYPLCEPRLVHPSAKVAEAYYLCNPQPTARRV